MKKVREKNTGSLLLVNPWIYDFAAHDLWAKPLGLLRIASALRRAGFPVLLADCMDTHHPSLSAARPKKAPFGTGKFPKEEAPRPLALSRFERRYYRYGIKPEAFAHDISLVDRPCAVIVTSLMTYWYPGVAHAIRIVKDMHPGVPVILGGIYARLCPRHAAKAAGADLVWDGSEEISFLSAFLREQGIMPGAPERGLHPYPAFDLLHGLDYVCIISSSGCPLSCSYCASRFLTPSFSRRPAEDVLREILYWSDHHAVKDFAFYDDALLMGDESQVKALLRGIIRLGGDFRFHTPNALHASRIDRETARLLFDAGFKTIRLGLETADPERQRGLDAKLRQGEFERAADALLREGFTSQSLGAYVLAGLPDQEPDDVMRSLDYLKALGIPPYLAEYSPIPHTRLWRKAIEAAEYDLQNEPLYHNNSILPCWSTEKRAAFRQIKGAAKSARESFTAGYQRSIP